MLIVVQEGPLAVVARAGHVVLALRPPGATTDFMCWLAGPVLDDTALDALRSSLDGPAWERTLPVVVEPEVIEPAGGSAGIGLLAEQ